MAACYAEAILPRLGLWGEEAVSQTIKQCIYSYVLWKIAATRPLQSFPLERNMAFAHLPKLLILDQCGEVRQQRF